VPDEGDGLSEGKDLGPFFRIHYHRVRLWMRPILSFKAIEGREFLIPVALQATRDESVFGVARNIASPCEFALVASPFESALPLPICCQCPLFELGLR
jgi:hypothetical protein